MFSRSARSSVRESPQRFFLVELTQNIKQQNKRDIFSQQNNIQIVTIILRHKMAKRGRYIIVYYSPLRPITPRGLGTLGLGVGYDNNLLACNFIKKFFFIFLFCFVIVETISYYYNEKGTMFLTEQSIIIICIHYIVIWIELIILSKQ